MMSRSRTLLSGRAPIYKVYGVGCGHVWARVFGEPVRNAVLQGNRERNSPRVQNLRHQLEEAEAGCIAVEHQDEVRCFGVLGEK